MGANLSKWAKGNRPTIETGPRGGKFYRTGAGTKIYGVPGPGKPPPAGSPAPETSSKPKIVESPIFGHQYDHLPEDATQTATTKEAIGADAKVAHEQQLDLLDHGTGLDKTIGATVIRGDQIPLHDLEKQGAELEKIKGPVIIIGPMKNLDGRAAEKVQKEEKGKWENLRDVVRSSVAVDSHKDIPALVQHLQRAGIVVAKRPKDRFANPTDGGYRDILMNLRYPNGHIGELQIHTKALLATKNAGGHRLYDEVRKIDGNAKESGRDKTPEEEAAVDRLNVQSKALYGPAWNRSK